MIIGWLVYGFMVATLLGAAAWLAERAARSFELPGRWPWAAALVGSIALPLATWLAPAPAPDASFAPLPGAYVMESLPALTLDAGGAGLTMGEVALWAWAASSLALLIWLLMAVLRLRRQRRGWRPGLVEGVSVLVSAATGPAALGVLRPRVVVPEWALALDERRRRLLILHEAEHVRAHDPALAFLGLVVCMLAPWNPALWWQLARLRLALEVDCDARVLRRADDAHGYGSLLLEVGQRRAAFAVGLAESKTTLERRIRMMVTNRRRRTLPALGLAAVAVVVLAMACETPGPSEAASPEPTGVDAELSVASDRWSEIGRSQCPPVFFVDGVRVTDIEIEDAKIESIEVLKGGAAEALLGEDGRCGVVHIFTKDTSPQALQGRATMAERFKRASERVRRGRAQMAQDTPLFTPMTVRPTLRNAPDVSRALMDNYPPLLKNAGVGGTANVWFHIDENGKVVKTMINESSGYEALDAAALRVAKQMEFTPAYNKEEPVAVWIALDIRFEAQ